jgi:hypothetical protein
MRVIVDEMCVFRENGSHPILHEDERFGHPASNHDDFEPNR